QVERCGVPQPPGAACPEAEPHTARVLSIKRVVAGPGDLISIADGHVIRNGSREADPYIQPCDKGVSGCNFPTTIKIPPDNWFLLGDIRGYSDDGGFGGPVPSGWIVGTVQRIFPRGGAESRASIRLPKV